MNYEVKKVVFLKGKGMFEIYVCRYPYTKDDIIQEGLPYDEWCKLAYYEKDN